MSIQKSNLPNIITLSRIGFVPFIIIVLYSDSLYRHWYAAGLFILASLTDYLDGELARRLQAQSIFGKFMDPLADKILITSILIIMIPLEKLSPILVIILLGRDTLVAGLRAIAASHNIIISAGQIGKWKTVLQMIAIFCILIKIPSLPLSEVGHSLLWISVILSLISAFIYYLKYKKSLKI